MTLTVHLPPTTSVPLLLPAGMQVLVCTKSLPVSKPKIERVSLPVFVKVTVCGALLVRSGVSGKVRLVGDAVRTPVLPPNPLRDRKSTRLNSSHGYISYAVFCLKKKKKQEKQQKSDHLKPI